MNKTIVELNAKFTVKVKPKTPFNFDATVNKPSHLRARCSSTGNLFQRKHYLGKLTGDMVNGRR